MGANTWAATRLMQVGPDGRLAWDRLPRLAIYVGPMTDAVNASSNGGATTHAYGIRASLNSYSTRSTSSAVMQSTKDERSKPAPGRCDGHAGKWPVFAAHVKAQ